MSKRFVSSIKRSLLTGTAAIIAGSFSLAFLVAALLPGTFSAWNNGVIDRFMRARYRIQGRQEISPYLIHVVLNDSSQRDLGLASWDRSAFAEVIEALQDTPVRSIACDIFFKDASPSGYDEPLLAATGRARKVLFPILVYPRSYFPLDENEEWLEIAPDRIEPHLLYPSVTRSGNPPVGEYAIPPFPRLSERALGLGHVNYTPDRDGMCRRVALLYRYESGFIPAISLRIILDYFAVPEENIEVEFGRRIVLRHARVREDLFRDVEIPIDRQGRIIVNFAAPWNDSFLNFPVHKLLAAVNDTEARAHLFDLMDGAVVILSDITTTNRDYGPGVFETVYPLSGVHVNIVNSILTDNHLKDQRLTSTILITALFAVPLCLLALRFRGLGFSIGSVILYLLFIVFSLWLFVGFSRVPVIAAPTAGFLLALVAVNVYRIVVVEKERSAYKVRSEAGQKLEAVNRELIRQKRDLELANRRLAEVDRFKTRFVQNIVHELRTPLTLIVEPLDSICSHENEGFSGSAPQQLASIRENAHMLLQLVNRFLDLSKFKAGKERLRVSRSDLIEYLRTLLQRFEPMAEHKRVRLKFSSTAETLPSYFDAGKLDTIFTNLLSNSLKVTEPNDLIEIKIVAPSNGVKPHGETTTAELASEQMVRIDVRDTGAGIPEGDIPHIFERFHQIDHPSVKTGGGSGVGLSLVKECVSIHHGHIDVESKLGVGTRFRLYLPWAKHHFLPDEIAELRNPSGPSDSHGVHESLQVPEDTEAAGATPAGVAPSGVAPAGVATACDTEAADQPAGPGGFPRRIEGRYPVEPILIVEDELDLLEYYSQQLKRNALDNMILCCRGEDVMPLLRKQDVSIILLDLSLPGISGRKLLAEIKENHPGIHILVITGVQDVEVAVECIKLGAFDYMVKPVELSRLLAKIHHGLDKRNLEKQIDVLSRKIQTTELKHPEAFAEIVTHNPAMISKFRYVEAVAETGNPVLITGESGVGKELIARVIHRLSGRQGQFVCENIAGLDDTMISDTLFGHAKGAFTDAEGVRKGLVERAAGGTLFLDEIGDMSTGSQVKLLRFIEQKEYRPLGADKVKVSDARIIIATNADLQAKLEAGTFRKDLFYRLTHHIHIPPLRERPDDLPYLVAHFVSSSSQDLGRKPPQIGKELLLRLQSYDFPGNIRELKNMIENAMSRGTDRSLSPAAFAEYLPSVHRRKKLGSKRDKSHTARIILPERFPRLKDMEEYMVSEALHRSGGNQNEAARLLGLSPSALSRRIKNMGRAEGA